MYYSLVIYVLYVKKDKTIDAPYIFSTSWLYLAVIVKNYYKTSTIYGVPLFFNFRSGITAESQKSCRGVWVCGYHPWGWFTICEEGEEGLMWNNITKQISSTWLGSWDWQDAGVTLGSIVIVYQLTRWLSHLHEN